MITIIYFQFNARKRKRRNLFPRTEYSQLTTLDEDLVPLKSTALTVADEPVDDKQAVSLLEEPT